MGTHRCGCAVYTKPKLIHLLKGTLPVWRGSCYFPLLSRSFNTMREVVQGDQPDVTDGWACCRFLFLHLLSIRNIFKAASLTPLHVSHKPQGLILLEKEWRGALYNPYTTHLPAINYWKVTTESYWTWRRCSITALGEHQGAADHPPAFQIVTATGCTKVRKSSHPRTASKMAKTILFHKFR